MQMQWPSDLVTRGSGRDAHAVQASDWAVRAVHSLLAERQPPRAKARRRAGSPELVRKDWFEVEAVILRAREACLARYPAMRATCTLADLERLLTLVVAVPGYQFARRRGGHAPPPLHPVLGSLLRIGESLRHAAAQLRLRQESGVTSHADLRVRAGDVLALVEPQQPPEAAMTQLFLRSALDGVTVSPLPVVRLALPVQQAVDDLDAAFDYALLGMQAAAVVASLGPLLARAHGRVASMLQAAGKGARRPPLDRLQAWVRAADALLQDHGLDAAVGRAGVDTMHAEDYAQCAAGLGDPVRQSLAARLAAQPADLQQAAGDELRSALRRRAGGADAAAFEWLLDCLMHTFARIQQVLALVEEIQERIDALLDAPRPRPARGTADLQHALLAKDTLAHRLPALLAELEQVLGFRATITAGAIGIQAFEGLPQV